MEFFLRQYLLSSNDSYQVILQGCPRASYSLLRLPTKSLTCCLVIRLLLPMWTLPSRPDFISTYTWDLLIPSSFATWWAVTSIGYSLILTHFLSRVRIPSNSLSVLLNPSLSSSISYLYWKERTSLRPSSRADFFINRWPLSGYGGEFWRPPVWK